MQKRGQEGPNLILITIASLVMAALVVFVFPTEAKAIISGQESTKTVASREIALILNTICSYPQDIEIEYDLKLNDIVIEIKDDKVTAHNKAFVSIAPNKDVSGKDPQSKEHSFVCPIKLTFSLDEPKKILFKKKDNNIEVKKLE